MTIEDKIKEQLKKVSDPEVGINIVDMGLIYGIELADRTANITMTLTSPGCPAAGQIVNEAQQQVEKLEPIDAANLHVVWSPRWTPEMMTEEARDELGLF